MKTFESCINSVILYVYSVCVLASRLMLDKSCIFVNLSKVLKHVWAQMIEDRWCWTDDQLTNSLIRTDNTEIIFIGASLWLAA